MSRRSRQSFCATRLFVVEFARIPANAIHRKDVYDKTDYLRRRRKPAIAEQQPSSAKLVGSGMAVSAKCDIESTEAVASKLSRFKRDEVVTGSLNGEPWVSNGISKPFGQQAVDRGRV